MLYKGTGNAVAYLHHLVRSVTTAFCNINFLLTVYAVAMLYEDVTKYTLLRACASTKRNSACPYIDYTSHQSLFRTSERCTDETLTCTSIFVASNELWQAWTSQQRSCVLCGGDKNMQTPHLTFPLDGFPLFLSTRFSLCPGGSLNLKGSPVLPSMFRSRRVHTLFPQFVPTSYSSTYVCP